MNQIEKILKICDGFPEFKPKNGGGYLLSPREYVTNVLESFEEHIMRCENILQII